MGDILNFDVQKDNILKDVIKGNPYYINIKGSVNICLIRCGQEIESCNDVNFASMTNYGKILVLNPKSGTDSKCKVQLAFDSSNTNCNDSGGADYKFEKAFFTVPSLHRLNDQLYDMETFLLFSSVQTNGNVLYILLCTLNNATDNIPKDDNLLNYKLLDSLFSKNNTIPDIFGTSSINGIPNPVNINNFIPSKGKRNFYDYTHPNNTKVNFRVFQNTMAISNTTLNLLKSKLTPGDTFVNFKKYIVDSLNPTEGLFFYFSEDLSDRYSSFAVNKYSSKSIEKFNNEDDQNKILDDNQNNIDVDKTSYNKNNSIDKIDVKKKNKKSIEKNNDDSLDDALDDTLDYALEDPLEDALKDDTLNGEKFESGSGDSYDKKKSGTLAISILILSWGIYAFLFYGFLTRLFGKADEISEVKKSQYINMLNNNLTNDIIQSIISIRFKYSGLSVLSGIFIFIIIILFVFYLKNDSKKVLKAIQSIGFILLFIFVIKLWLIIRYIFNRFKLIHDDDFLNIENVLVNYISDDLKKVIFNFKSLMKEDLTVFVPNIENNGNTEQILDIKQPNNSLKSMSGGAGNKEPVPTPSLFGTSNNKDNLNTVTEKTHLKSMTIFSDFYNIFGTNILKEKFITNDSLSMNFYLTSGFIIFFFIIMSTLKLYFISYTENYFIKNIISILIIVVSYVPLIILLTIITYYITDNVFIRKINAGIGYTSILVGIISLLSTLCSNNISFWISIILIIVMILINVYAKFFLNNREEYSEDDLYENSLKQNGSENENSSILNNSNLKNHDLDKLNEYLNELLNDGIITKNDIDTFNTIKEKIKQINLDPKIIGEDKSKRDKLNIVNQLLKQILSGKVPTEKIQDRLKNILSILNEINPNKDEILPNEFNSKTIEDLLETIRIQQKLIKYGEDNKLKNNIDINDIDINDIDNLKSFFNNKNIDNKLKDLESTESSITLNKSKSESVTKSESESESVTEIKTESESESKSSLRNLLKKFFKKRNPNKIIDTTTLSKIESLSKIFGNIDITKLNLNNEKIGKIQKFLKKLININGVNKRYSKNELTKNIKYIESIIEFLNKIKSEEKNIKIPNLVIEEPDRYQKIIEKINSWDWDNNK